MKGLLIKDLKLMKNQKNFFLVILVVIAFLAAGSDDLSFPMGFTAFIGTLFTLSSISYDEFDNGNAFLFSLPITRKQYVLEKYGFGLLLGIGSLLTAVCLLSAVRLVKGELSLVGRLSEIGFTVLAVLALNWGFLALMLPLQLKFGSEKGRVAILGVFGVAAVLGMLASKSAAFFRISVTAVWDGLSAMGVGMAGVLLLVLSFGILVCSMAVSMAIVKKKEF
ncbi:MAG TPA: ABC-2 transporter permease [Candidatus Fimimorpha excrementavium]|nr:ABC-2 transporter permease [Candidatus Fimimorpha excrementavium]